MSASVPVDSSPSPGDLVRARREAHGLSQAQLALRSGSTQASLSRLERGELSPTVATLARMLECMGERLELASIRPETEWDAAHIRDVKALAPEERLERAISRNRLAGEVAAAGDGRAEASHDAA